MATMTISPLAGGNVSGSVVTRSKSVSHTQVVLTARGRAVLAGAMLILVVFSAYLISGWLAGGAAAGQQPLFATATVTVTVQAGDTLWSLAQERDGEADPRALVDRIAELNGLATDAVLQPGQLLVLPVMNG